MTYNTVVLYTIITEKISFGISEKKGPLGILRYKWGRDMNVEEIVCEVMNYIHLA